MESVPQADLRLRNTEESLAQKSRISSHIFLPHFWESTGEGGMSDEETLEGGTR